MTDTALQPARKRLADAISALIDPRREHLDGHTLYTDSLYQQLSDSLAGQQGHAHHTNPKSLPILWLDAHVVLDEIDTTVAQWHPQATQPNERPWRDKHRRPPTVERLEALSDAKYRPQDVPTLQDRADQLGAWAREILNLILPEITVWLRGETCPVCSNSHIQRHDTAGELVTAPALVIRQDGALCQACRATWEPARLPMLGRMLGHHPANTGILE